MESVIMMYVNLCMCSLATDFQIYESVLLGNTEACIKKYSSTLN